MRPLAAFVICLAACGNDAASDHPSADASARADDAAMGSIDAATDAGAQKRPRVYAHFMEVYPPPNTSPDHSLLQNPADLGATSIDWSLAFAEVQAAGIDGVWVDDLLDNNAQAGAREEDFTAQLAGAPAGFTVAPCLDTSASSDPLVWVTEINHWLDVAAATPNPAAVMRESGRPVIVTYGDFIVFNPDLGDPNVDFGTSGWASVRPQLKRDIYLVCDVSLVPGNLYAQYAAACDALYSFTPSTALSNVFAAESADSPRIAAVSPGYYNSANGSFSRLYAGTQTYRQGWADALQTTFGDVPPQTTQAAADWVTITTWNDYGEDTHIQPSRDQSNLYAKLTSAALAQASGATPTTAQTFWLTSPAEMPDGPGQSLLEADPRREVIFEVTRIGAAGGQSSTCTVTITQPNGDVVFNQQLTIDGAASVSAAQLSWQPTTTLGLPYLVVTATIGAQSVSLPLQLWQRALSHRFYMEPLRGRLSPTSATPTAPAVSLSTTNANGCSLATKNCLVVSEILPSPPQHTDVTLNLASRTSTDPNFKGLTYAGTRQLPAFAAPWGYWNAALVSPDDVLVEWGVPFFIAPPMVSDVALLSESLFSGGNGNDTSIYGRNVKVTPATSFVTLVPAQGSTPAETALDCSSAVDAEPAGSYLPFSSQATITVEMWVYPKDQPKESSATLFGDIDEPLSLALSIDSMTGALTPLAGRGWKDTMGLPNVTHAQSPSTIPKQAWTHILGVYTPQLLSLYVNGALVASATVPMSDAGSQVMAVGRNPAGGAYIFNGYIRDLRMYSRALTGPELSSTVANPPSNPM